MSWRVDFAPEVERDVVEAAAWYEARQARLGERFLEEVIQVWDALSETPLLGCRRHPIYSCVAGERANMLRVGVLPPHFPNRLPVQTSPGQ